MRNAEAPPEGPLLQGIRVDAAFRVGMPCAREGRMPLRKTKKKPKRKRGTRRKVSIAPTRLRGGTRDRVRRRDRLKGHPGQGQ